MMEVELQVPAAVRELTARSIDQTETAFKLFFNATSSAIPPSADTAFVLFQRTVQAKLEYARQVTSATDFRDTMAAHTAFLRTQIAIASDLIRIHTNDPSTLPR